jgi:hypothetical protein
MINHFGLHINKQGFGNEIIIFFIIKKEIVQTRRLMFRGTENCLKGGVLVVLREKLKIILLGKGNRKRIGRAGYHIGRLGK